MYQTTRPPAQQVRITLSPPAYKYLTEQQRIYQYHGRGPAQRAGLAYYLASLLDQNPPTSTSTSPCSLWIDTRPPDLIKHDILSLKRGQFPIWSLSPLNYYDTRPFERRLLRCLNATVFNTTLLPPLLHLAAHFMIAPISGRQTSPLSRAAAVIEAIGLQYLTPLNPPVINPTPARLSTTRRHIHTELVF